MAVAAADRAKPQHADTVEHAPPPAPEQAPAAPGADDDLGIPGFLRRHPEAEVAPPTAPEQTGDTSLLWKQTTPTRFEGHFVHESTTGVFKITPAGDDKVIKHFMLEVKPVNADWSQAKVIGRFKELDAAKAAAQAHKAEAVG